MIFADGGMDWIGMATFTAAVFTGIALLIKSVADYHDKQELKGSQKEIAKAVQDNTTITVQKGEEAIQAAHEAAKTAKVAAKQALEVKDAVADFNHTLNGEGIIGALQKIREKQDQHEEQFKAINSAMADLAVKVDSNTESLRGSARRPT